MSINNRNRNFGKWWWTWVTKCQVFLQFSMFMGFSNQNLHRVGIQVPFFRLGPMVPPSFRFPGTGTRDFESLATGIFQKKFQLYSNYFDFMWFHQTPRLVSAWFFNLLRRFETKFYDDDHCNDRIYRNGPQWCERYPESLIWIFWHWYFPTANTVKSFLTFSRFTKWFDISWIRLWRCWWSVG